MTPKMATDKVKHTLRFPFEVEIAGNTVCITAGKLGVAIMCEYLRKQDEQKELAERIVLAVNNHENLVEALQAYEDAAVLLTDQQLIDNQPLMNAIVKGRELLLKVAEATLCPTK